MKKSLLTLIIVAASFAGIAQVAVNTDGSTAQPTAIPDIKSDTAGLLVPRMTAAQREAINNPAQGLLVFDTSDSMFYYFENNNWQLLGRSASGWLGNDTIIYTDLKHRVVIGNNTTTGVFEVVTPKATGSYTDDLCVG